MIEIIYLLLSTALFLSFSYIFAKKLQASVAVAFIIGLIIRIAASVVFSSVQNYDTDSYELVARSVLSGANIYMHPALEHHPYFPLFLYIPAFTALLTSSPQLFIFILKLIFSLFDSAIILLVYRTALRKKNAALLYAVNPVTILTTCYHGQFDAVVLLFLLCSFYYLSRTVRERTGMLLFSAAIALKTWPLLLIAFPFKKVRNWKNLLLLAVFPLITTLIYSFLFSSHIQDIVGVILRYRGVYGEWGMTKYLLSEENMSSQFRILFSSLVVFLIFLYSIKLRWKRGFASALKVLLLFFVFTPSFGVQWLMWLVPFFLIVMPRYTYGFLMAVFVYVFLTYGSWIAVSASTAPLWHATLTIAGFILYVLFILYWVYMNMNFIYNRRRIEETHEKTEPVSFDIGKE